SGASAESGGLYSVKTDGTGLTLLYDFLPSGSGNPSALFADLEHIDWSPDGKKIAFGAWGGVEGLTLRILDVATGTVHTLQPLTSLNARAYTPDWSPDQDPVTPGYQGKLAFTGFLDQDTNSDLYVLDVTIGVDGTLTTGTVTNLTNTPSISEGTPAWSPDGQS